MKKTFFLIIFFLFAGVTFGQTKIYFQNLDTVSYRVLWLYDYSLVKESKQPMDSIMISNPLFLKELKIQIKDSEASVIQPSFVCDSPIIYIKIYRDSVVLPNREYNIKLNNLILFIRTFFTRANAKIYGYDRMSKIVDSVNFAFCKEHPRSENIIKNLQINFECGKYSSNQLKELCNLLPKDLVNAYGLAKNIRLFRKPRIYYQLNDHFKWNSILRENHIFPIKNKGKKLLIFIADDCHFSQEWDVDSNHFASMFSACYTIHLDSPKKPFPSTEKNVYHLWVKDNRLHKRLIGFDMCSVPFIVVLNKKNRIEFIGRKGFWEKYKESKK